jgi:hypothetical protein
LESLQIIDDCVKETEFSTNSKGTRNSTALEDYVANNSTIFDPDKEEELDEYEDFEEEEPEIKEENTTATEIEKDEPKMCYLCDLEFDVHPDVHFSTVHKLVDPDNSKCTNCEFETEFP